MNDWRDEASCVVTDPNDKTCIEKPDELGAARLRRMCARCAVIEECFRWAESNNVQGVWCAGEWWESEG